VPVLLGLGLDEFSMTASAIPAAKALIRTLSMPQAQQLAHACLQLTDLADVQQFLSQPF
jgi:phosphoenolpyruvate-protein kinase (PTS system EI component)